MIKFGENLKSMPKALKKWNGRSQTNTRGTVYVAAYSSKQACEIVGMAFGLYRPMSSSELSKYWSKGVWGTKMDGITPTEPCVYFAEGYGNNKPELLYPKKSFSEIIPEEPVKEEPVLLDLEDFDFDREAYQNYLNQKDPNFIPEAVDENAVTAKNTIELLQQAAKHNTKLVEVVFVAPYNDKEHGFLKDKLKETLKKNKVEVFNVIEEATEIIHLVNNKDVQSIRFIETKPENKYSLCITRYSSNNHQRENSRAMMYFPDAVQAIKYAKQMGVLTDISNNYQIREIKTGRLSFGKEDIKNTLGNEDFGVPERYENGGYLDKFNDEVQVEEYEAQDYIKNEISEAEALLFSNQGRLAKVMVCKAKIETAQKNMDATESGYEKNVWQEVLNIWNDYLKDIKTMKISISMPVLEEIYADAVKQYPTTLEKLDDDPETMEKGGIAYGNSHAKGGMPLTVKSTGQNIEIEGGEGVLTKKTMQSSKKVELDGKEMSPCEAASKLNQMGGGVKFKCEDVKEIIEKDGEFQ